MASETMIKVELLAESHSLGVFDERLNSIRHAFREVVEYGICHKLVIIILGKYLGTEKSMLG